MIWGAILAVTGMTPLIETPVGVALSGIMEQLFFLSWMCVCSDWFGRGMICILGKSSASRKTMFGGV